MKEQPQHGQRVQYEGREAIYHCPCAIPNFTDRHLIWVPEDGFRLVRPEDIEAMKEGT